MSIVTVFTLSSYTVVSKHDIEFSGEISIITPQLIKRLVRGAGLKGKAFIVFVNDSAYYATKVKEGFSVIHLTAQD